MASCCCLGGKSKMVLKATDLDEASVAFDRGQAHVNSKQYAEAARCFDRAITLLEEGAQSEPAFKSLMGRVQLRYGDLCVETTKAEEARQHYMSSRLHGNPKAAAALAKLANRPPPKPPLAPSSEPHSVDPKRVHIEMVIENPHLETKGRLQRDLSRLDNVYDLVETFNEGDLGKKEKTFLQYLALNMIDYFGELGAMTPDRMLEFQQLGACNDPVILEQLLATILKRIQEGPFLQPVLLRGLAEVVIRAPLEHLRQDVLVNIMQTILKQLENTHTQLQNEGRLVEVLQALTIVIDAMGDTNVVDVDRELIDEPVRACLKDLTRSDLHNVQMHSVIAHQSFLRIPNDEGKVLGSLRRGTALVKAVYNLYQGVHDLDASALLESFGGFYTAFERRGGKEAWYEQYRFCQILVRSHNYAALDAFFLNEKSVHFSLSRAVIQLLDDVLAHETDPAIVDPVVKLLEKMFLDEKRFGNHQGVTSRVEGAFLGLIGRRESIQTSVATKLSFYLAYQHTHEQVKSAINRMRVIPVEGGTLSSHQRSLIEEKFAVFDDKIELQEISIPRVTNELFQQAQRRQGSNDVNWVLRTIRESVFRNPSVNATLEMYIETFGRDPNIGSTPFALLSKVEAFLASDQKVFLISGDSGSGKSTFMDFFERHLWNQRDQGSDLIPIHICLPKVVRDFPHLVREALSGFFSEDQIKELKRNSHNVVFLLDAYDEMKRQDNVIQSSDIQHWPDAKIIITCRTNYFSQFKNPLQLFLPEGATMMNLQHVAVAPFSRSQVENYVGRYLAKHPESIWTQKQYMEKFEEIEGVSTMMTNPFVLSMLVKFLPDIIKEHENTDSKEKLKIVQNQVYKAFADAWFQRQQEKILREGIDCGQLDVTDMIGQFYSYSTGLASTMVQEDTLVVNYEPPSRISWGAPRSTAPKTWDKFFNNELETSIVRSGCPIVKEGHQYSFLHASLVDYFAFRGVRG